MILVFYLTIFIDTMKIQLPHLLGFCTLLIVANSLVAQDNPCREPGVSVSPTPVNLLEKLTSSETFDVFTDIEECFTSFDGPNPRIIFSGQQVESEGTVVNIFKYRKENQGETSTGTIRDRGDSYVLEFNEDNFQFGVLIRFRNPGTFELLIVGAGEPYDGVYPITVTSAAPVNWVEELSFSPFAENLIQLNWAVSEQVDVQGYEVERMLADEDAFKKIDDIAVNDNGSLKASYSAVAHRSTRSAYYRVKQNDYAGTYDYSNVIFVPGNDGATQQFAVFPNPARDYARLSLPDDILSVDLVNSAGQVVSRTPAPEARREGVDVRGVPAGVYYVRPVGGTRGARPQRLIVAR